ncbi:type I 3-dehydroquinate dehydratase [Alteribacillus sp. HJP-4]|uniref:type I 3-dehydroquinate dehydratase n=1 Tax=Alteribacillus sp. HJP-4 TaxID=2775394 RepID=UPI0035CD2018
MNENKRIIEMKGKRIGGEDTLICTPVVGGDMGEIVEEINKIKPKKPDIIEWRADYFRELEHIDKVKDALNFIYEAMEQTPLLFTIRSEKEGGGQISLTEEEKINLINEICASGKVDLIDYELINNDLTFKRLREVSKRFNVKMVGSYHNFESTPDDSILIGKMKEAETRGADIAKVSVMANEEEDVLSLLRATKAADKIVSIPLVTISMGKHGNVTRLIGRMFGSTITFGIGENSSAPGQLPIDDIRIVLNILNKSS